jgi:hypothetical protein
MNVPLFTGKPAYDAHTKIVTVPYTGMYKKQFCRYVEMTSNIGLIRVPTGAFQVRLPTRAC